MAKFYGEVGYAETEETAPSVWTESIVEFPYYGDVTKNTKRWVEGDSLNDNLQVSTIISIIADPYANQHFFAIRYVNWMGVRWKVTTVEPQPPRLLLTLGEVYNGITPDTGSDSEESSGDD